ncbi:hypothetical protein ACIQMJ_26390 [Actinosynnema sp. NPDC091369]
MTGTWGWLGLAALGAYHGVNPAMGWLFAVARGLYDKRTRAVVQALGPIAAGHALSVALVVGLFTASTVVVDPDHVRWGAAVVLVGFGVFKLAKPRSHPRWSSFRVSAPALVLWSLLMSTAHGAGLMLLPLLLSATPSEEHSTHHSHSAAGHEAAGAQSPVLADGPADVLLALGLHTAAMLAVMGLVAIVVYRKVGLNILRKAWVNLDLLWAGVLVLSGLFLLL